MYLSFSVVVDTPVECTRISVGHGEVSIPVKRNLIKNFPSRCKMHIAYTVYTALYAEIIIFNCKNDGENKAIQLKPVMHSFGAQKGENRSRSLWKNRDLHK